MSRYNGKYANFLDRAQIEEGGHEGAVQQRSQGRMEIFSADAARITDEKASSEDRKHTSGGVFVAVDSYLGAVVGAEEEQLYQSQATRVELPKHG